MKNLKTLLLATAATVALPLSAAQYVFVPGNDRLETKICIAVAENNLIKYKHKVRLLSTKRRPDYDVVANTLQCNDQSLASFALKYEADRTAAFISRSLEHEVIIRREISEAKESSKSLADDEIIYVTVN